MNSDCKYYNTVDENFEKAINLYEKNLEYDDLISLLESEKVVDKQIAVLRLNTIKSEKDAQILVSNLTGQDGKVREAVSFKLNEFMADNELVKYFQNPANFETFFNATLDINGNICRNTISAISNIKNNHDFAISFCKILVETIYKLLDNIEKFDLQEGKYKVNKEIFKLYWCLEDMYEFIDFININDVKSILSRTKCINEYTIREKTAKILTKNFSDNVLLKIKEELKQDKNYYVKRY